MNIEQGAFCMQFQRFAPEMIPKANPLLTHYLIDQKAFFGNLWAQEAILGMGNAKFFLIDP
jgi:hypothetical protein